MGQSTGHWRYANGRGRETLGKRSIFTEKFGSSSQSCLSEEFDSAYLTPGAVTSQRLKVSQCPVS